MYNIYCCHSLFRQRKGGNIHVRIISIHTRICHSRRFHRPHLQMAGQATRKMTISLIKNHQLQLVVFLCHPWHTSIHIDKARLRAYLSYQHITTHAPSGQTQSNLLKSYQKPPTGLEPVHLLITKQPPFRLATVAQ